MTPYDPTLATLVGIAAFSWIGAVDVGVIMCRNWGKGRRRRER